MLSVRVVTEDLGELSDSIKKAVFKAAPDVDIEFTYGRGPVAIDHDIEGEPVTSFPDVSTDDSEGFEAAVMNYGTDIPSLKGDHKRYLYGPGSILTAHSEHEFVKISDLEKAVDGYQIIILEALKR